MGRILVSALFLLYTLNCYSLGCKQLRIASGADNWVPISYIDRVGSNQYQGVAFDIAKEVAKYLGLPLSIDDLPWKRMLFHLEAGKIDMAIAIYKSEAREKIYLYTVPYTNNEARIFVKKGLEFSFNNLKDLDGLTGAIPAAGSFGDEFDSYVKENKHNFFEWHNRAQRESQFRFIMNRRRDYYVADYLDGMSKLKRAGLQGQIVPLPHSLAKNTVHFALSKKSPCKKLVPQINQIIEKLKQEGFVSRVVEKHLNLPPRAYPR